MTWPASDVVTTNLDAGTDSPATARAQLLDLVQKFNQLRTHVSAAAQALLDDADAAAMRETLGTNAVVPTATTGLTVGVAHKGGVLLATGTVTVPASVFAAGDVLSIYNNSASSISVAQGASLTLRQAGTANTGTRTLLQRGVATVLFISPTEAVISGSGLA